MCEVGVEQGNYDGNDNDDDDDGDDGDDDDIFKLLTVQWWLILLYLGN